jgi:hypothetical protein
MTVPSHQECTLEVSRSELAQALKIVARVMLPQCPTRTVRLCTPCDLDHRSLDSYTIKSFSCQNGFMPFLIKRLPVILSAEQRQRLLRHFMNFLNCEEFHSGDDLPA